MTSKRFTLNIDTEWWVVEDDTIKVNEFGYREDLTGEDKYRGLQQELTEKEVVKLLNELYEENEELKQEVELLREGLDAYDNNIPLYLTCREVRDFHSDLFEFKIKQQKFYNEHPNRCKIIIDGVELK